MVWFALTLLVLFSFAGFAVDVANLWFTAQKIQKAADAGALAAATYMPSDLATGRTRAKEIAARNGYSDAVSGYTTNATVTVTQEANPYRVRVRVAHTVRTFFATLMGVSQISLDREAVGEYQGPVPMGSPTNNLGNQPAGSGNSQWLATSPVDTANTNPQIWTMIAGRNEVKINGDRYASYSCDSSTYNCTSSVNNEYTANGYFFTVRVNVAAGDLAKKLVIQGFDPAFIQTGQRCDDLTTSTTSGAEQTVRNELVALGVDRYYAPSPYTGSAFNSTYCPGDHYLSSSSSLPTTTYTIRQADQTPWNNVDNPVVTTTGCAAQSLAPLPNASVTSSSRISALLNPTNTSATAQYARSVYHQWYSLCHLSLASLGITTAGTHDVILQVQTGSSGYGQNRFALRTGLTTATSITSTTAVEGNKTTVYGSGRLPLFANSNGADSRFYLARLLPGNAGRTLSVQLFDVGDAADTGQIQVLPPVEATVNGTAISSFSNCTFSRLPTGGTAMNTTASACRINNVNSSNGFNGRMVIFNVPIPAGYDCNETSTFGCWVKVRFTYPSGTEVNDATTWSANILGDPVRLVE